MLGLMQDWPLTADKLIDQAARWHGEREVVSRNADGSVSRTTYAEVHSRAKQVTNGLRAAGVKLGDRVATLAFNSARHLEAMYGIMGMGAVCHTLNPRLFPEQIAWMVNHAGDRLILADPHCAAIIKAIVPQCPNLDGVVWLCDAASLPDGEGLAYDSWIAGQSAEARWGGFDEQTAAGLCYTSGTTGDPKGVLYSHRSNVLTAMIALQADYMGARAIDVVLPIVPMFHANGWAVAFFAPAAGAKLVLPGPKLDGASVHELLESEGVTFAAAVPTVWQTLLTHLDTTGGKLSTLRRGLIGGAACPPALMRAYGDRYDVEIMQSWGMTETSPLGVMGKPVAATAELPAEERFAQRMKQGRAPFGIDLKIVDDDGEALPRDGRTSGRLMVRGPNVARAYFGREDVSILDSEGYFDTGDIATIDRHGYMRITDRAKDVIKSGGEWISSVDIENLMAGHPKVALAAVIGVPHPKWDERPLLIVALKAGETATSDEMLEFLSGKIAKWWTPDEVAFVEAIPLNATGKIDKKAIRAQFAGFRFAGLEAAQ
ncbi:MAG: long-chain-fatty-acid--CoA ligase [Caulobacteraceae bacterium]